MDIATFLLERVAEDEAAAHLVLAPYGDLASHNNGDWWSKEKVWWEMGLSSDETPLLIRMTPQRILAECEAKRDIIDLYRLMGNTSMEHADAIWVGLGEAIAMLALVYKDHPDYHSQWPQE